MNPSLNDVLAPFLLSKGFIISTRCTKTSTRPIKYKMAMLCWTKGADIDRPDPIDGEAVFIYENNTVGLRRRERRKVELDLSANDPQFLEKLEAWIDSNAKH